MLYQPMSSPMMTTMLGFFACAKALLAGNVAISAIATVSKDVNGDLTGFIESHLCALCLSAILDLRPIGLRFSCPRLSRNENRDDSCRYLLRLCRACPRCNANNTVRCTDT